MVSQLRIKRTIAPALNRDIAGCNHCRFDEAIKLFQDIIAVRFSNKVPNDSLLTFARDDLGLVFLQQGNISAAKNLFAIALEDSRKVAGDNKALIHSIQSHIARTLVPAEAITALTSIIAEQQKAQDLTASDLMEANVALAQFLLDQPQPQEALKYANQAINVGRKAYPNGHYLLVAPLIEQARILLALGRVTQANTALEEASKLIDQSPGVDPRHAQYLQALRASEPSVRQQSNGSLKL